MGKHRMTKEYAQLIRFRVWLRKVESWRLFEARSLLLNSGLERDVADFFQWAGTQALMLEKNEK